MERKKKQTYCLVCRDYTKSINPKIVRNRQKKVYNTIKLRNMWK